MFGRRRRHGPGSPPARDGIALADAFQMAKEAGRAEDPSVVELLSTIYVPATALGNAQTFDEFVGVELLADDIHPPTTDVSEILDGRLDTRVSGASSVSSRGRHTQEG